jgi:transposase InsO family protein
MTRYIDASRAHFGVEPICKTLQVAPSSYYTARRRPPSARCMRDEALKLKLVQVHKDQFGVYGARKLWHQLRREGTAVARCTVERLMRELGLRGVRRGRQVRTTIPDETAPRPMDLVLTALEQALWARKGPFDGLVHNSDRSVQYLSIRYTERLAERLRLAAAAIPTTTPWRSPPWRSR